MADINLLVPCGAELELMKKLIKTNTVNFCLTVHNNKSGKIGEGIRALDHRAMFFNRYDKICDINEVPALSKEILEKMRPFEGMILKFGKRITNYSINDIDDEKRNYLYALRFWNYIIEKYRINAMYFKETPHGQYNYIVYCLAIIKGIPLLGLQATSIPNICLYYDKIENCGNDLKYVYEVRREELKDISIENEVKAGYELFLSQSRNEEKEPRNMLKDDRESFGQWSGRNAVIRASKISLKYLLSSINVAGTWVPMDSKDVYSEFRNINSVRKRKGRMTERNRYNKRAVIPNLKEKYIYFGFQKDAEETTYPRGGVFIDQFTSIDILARATKKVGCKLYVKEHYVQKYRDTDIYDHICKYDNVVLVRSDYDSYDLISNALAVSTQTGTCIMEGVVKGVPALVFGDAYIWKGMPGVYEIHDENQCAKIVLEIIDGKKIAKEDVYNYFLAIQKCAIVNYPFPRHEREKQHNIKTKYELIKKWIGNECSLQGIWYGDF